jgi:DNA adenine methylase
MVNSTAASSNSLSKPAKPFLKWAGGKQQLLAQYEPFFPADFQRYLEPFVGSGAVFFHLWNTGRLPAEILLLDNNEELINTYNVVRDQVEGLISLLARHKVRHNRDYYYQIRELDRTDAVLTDVERAARTIYLNKTCFNGLYRVNSKGQFNVPMGRYKNPAILDEPRLRTASVALQNVRLGVRDVSTVVDLGQAGDFFYFDPPYVPVSETANFTSYTATNFGEEAQRRLAALFATLSDKGCRCMLSNSYTPLILELYDSFRIETVFASRAINSDAEGRGKVKEVVVLNY